MLKIAHVIHPVIVNPESDLIIAQPITFQSMLNAKNFSTNIEVELYSTKYEDEDEIVPIDFLKANSIKKSIFDLKEFKTPTKKLALIDDILNNLNDASNADYFIYTNVDIGVMPHFYEYLNGMIKKGYDAIAINRRTISQKYTSPNNLWEIYGDLGITHPGIDCFVFSKKAYKKFSFFDSFIGTGPVGLCFVANMIVHSDKFIWLENEHLTFHIGDDRIWLNPKHHDYEINNLKEAIRITENNLNFVKNDKVKEIILNSIIKVCHQRIRNITHNEKITASPKKLLSLFSNEQFNEILAADKSDPIQPSKKIKIFYEKVKNILNA